MDALLRRRLMMLAGSPVPPTPPTPILPTGYTEVQYLEMNGSGYISFGDRGSEARDAVEVDLEITTLTAQMRLVSTNTSGSPFQIYVSGALEMAYRFSGSYVSAGIALDTNRHIYGIDYPNHRVYRDTTVVTFSGTSTNATSGNIGIGVKLASNPQLKAKVYAAKMWRDGAALRNLIMCRDGNNAPYVYDTVSQAFMTIGGSGTTVGPDKN